MRLKRKITRETAKAVFDSTKHRAVIVTVDPSSGIVSFRLKGTRRKYGLPASYLYMHACGKHVALEKANKAKAKKKKRKAKR